MKILYSNVRGGGGGGVLKSEVYAGTYCLKRKFHDLFPTYSRFRSVKILSI